MELITSYFPDLTPMQLGQFEGLQPLYTDWNLKINVISRKDIDHLYEHHVLHSLALARYHPFVNGMCILDAGTGGGFPGIPLAIVYPEIEFTLLDATAKKLNVVSEIAKAIGLTNVQTVHSRLEEHKGRYDMIVSRAVSTLTQMVAWSVHLMEDPRWVMLKGGEPKELRKELPPSWKVRFVPVSEYFKEEYFLGKYLVDIRKK